MITFIEAQKTRKIDISSIPDGDNPRKYFFGKDIFSGDVYLPTKRMTDKEYKSIIKVMICKEIKDALVSLSSTNNLPVNMNDLDIRFIASILNKYDI